MSREISESPLETPHPDTPQPEVPEAPQPVPERLSQEELERQARPPMPPYSSTSGDELSLLLSESLTAPKPDPLLGSFSADTPTPEETPPIAAGPFPAEPPREALDAPATPDAADVPADSGAAVAEAPMASHAGATAGLATRGGSFDALATPEPGVVSSEAEESPVRPSLFDAFPFSATVPPATFDAVPVSAPVTAASSDAFPALDLSAPPSAKPAPSPEEQEHEEEDDDDHPGRRASLLVFLLFSYASAVTLGLLWVILSGRRLRESDDADAFPAADTRADPGRRADQSRKIASPPPIAADHLAVLGKPVRLGSLEATPLAISAGRVSLKRAIGNAETRDGGSAALKLKVRLRNISNDTIFAPLDEAFLRERDRDVLDSLIEAGDQGPIEMYPLAVSSEFSIVGQEFKELRPGESFDAVVVSASGAASRLAPEMTWRVRLRTGINRTDTLGVRFRAADVRSGS